jgi:two-component system, OmpR family, phosphate regulon response regulator PhoB
MDLDLGTTQMMRHITVVEDDEPFAILLKYNLEAHGFSVTCLWSGTDALLALSHPPFPNLVLLDWSLPGICGAEVLRHLRRNAGTHDIPVVMLTCHAERANHDHALALGASAFFGKQVALSTLMSRIRSLAGAAAAPQANPAGQ